MQQIEQITWTVLEYVRSFKVFCDHYRVINHMLFRLELSVLAERHCRIMCNTIGVRLIYLTTPEFE